MNLRLRKMLKLHKLLDAAGDETGSPAGTGEGPGGDAGAAAAAAAAEAAAAGAAAGGAPSDAAEVAKTTEGGGSSDDGKTKPTDAEANLLRDMMKHKGRANQLQGELETLRKQFDGIDPAKYREYLQSQAEDERKKLEARGEYDRVVAQMGERHTQAMTEQAGKLDAAAQTIAALQTQISELTVGNSFATSPVIGEELLMTRAKARAVYGAHFDFVDGKVVAYDKPRGASERTVLVKASGDAMDFNEALLHLVNTDPDPERDRLIRSRAKPGANSGTASASAVARKNVGRVDVALTPAERIAAGLRKAANRG